LIENSDGDGDGPVTRSRAFPGPFHRSSGRSSETPLGSPSVLAGAARPSARDRCPWRSRRRRGRSCGVRFRAGSALAHSRPGHVPTQPSHDLIRRGRGGSDGHQERVGDRADSRPQGAFAAQRYCEAGAPGSRAPAPTARRGAAGPRFGVAATVTWRAGEANPRIGLCANGVRRSRPFGGNGLRRPHRLAMEEKTCSGAQSCAGGHGPSQLLRAC
jgi:hypothetical protein